MSQDHLCSIVVFSNKAYNAIIRESFYKDPVETGGILLGHVLDNGIWVVMEVLPPGINSVFQYAYFEYDERFVNYLAQTVANQYKQPLELLGLWHRHPGSLDTFSSTDDVTNLTFASQNALGVISGLVNIDPRFRLTMYHTTSDTMSGYRRPKYTRVDIEVGDDIIPQDYFELRYYSNEKSDLHPYARDSKCPTGTDVLSHMNFEGEGTNDSENPTESDRKRIKHKPSKDGGKKVEKHPVFHEENKFIKKVSFLPNRLLTSVGSNERRWPSVLLWVFAVVGLCFIIASTAIGIKKIKRNPLKIVETIYDDTDKTHITSSQQSDDTDSTSLEHKNSLNNDTAKSNIK